MKIAFVTRCLTDGGTERVAALLSRLWTQSGHEVVVLTHKPAYPTDFPCQCKERLVADGGFWCASAFQDVLRQNRFDVCIFNGGWNDDGFDQLVDACGACETKCMVILHHAFNNWAFGQSNAGDFGKDALFAKVECLVCVDRLQALWWTRRGASVFYIPNPCAFNPGDFMATASTDSQEIVWVGRPQEPGKRIGLCIDAFALVAEKNPRARLTVVGLMPEGLRSQLRARVRGDVWDRISFAGYAGNVAPYLQRSRVSVLTTKWEVTVPQTALEAMAFGVPTVAMELPVLRPLAAAGNGIVCVRDVRSMALAIGRLLEDGTYRQDVMAGAGAFLQEAKVQTTQRWEALLSAVVRNSAEALVRDCQKDFLNESMLLALVDEVQRGESHFVREVYPKLMAYRRLKGRANKMLRIFGLKRKVER